MIDNRVIEILPGENMAKLSNKNYFGRAKREDSETMPAVAEDLEASTDKLEVLTLVDNSTTISENTVEKVESGSADVRLDETAQLIKRVGELETRVLLLENKLKTLINVITVEMSTGLKKGPEGLARAIKNSGVLDNF